MTMLGLAPATTTRTSSLGGHLTRRQATTTVTHASVSVVVAEVTAVIFAAHPLRVVVVVAAGSPLYSKEREIRQLL